MVSYSDVFPLSGGGSPDPYTDLKKRILIGWSGADANTDLGRTGIAVNCASSSSAQAKVGSTSLSLTGNAAPGLRVNEALSVLKQFSIGCWVRFNSFNYGGPFASWNSASLTSGQLLLNNDSGTTPTSPQFTVGYNGENAATASLSSGAWQVDTWYYMLCEWDGVNDKIRIYINNALGQETSIPSGAKLNLGSDTFSLGGYNLADNTITNMSGYIDEFVILYGNTTVAERNWLYNSGSGNSLA